MTKGFRHLESESASRTSGISRSFRQRVRQLGASCGAVGRRYGPCKSFCVRVAGERYLPFFGMRPSNMTAKWLRASFQLRIGIVHFLAASLIAMYTIFKADSSLG